MSLDDPAVVREEYATEAGLAARRSVYESLEGPDARETAFGAIAECRPRRVLEVGPGPGELAERVAAETGAEVVALDISPRMVELSRGRGVDARVGSAEELPWPDGSFDCAVAAWMLYHVADLDRALAELARVLRPGGRLVAVTNSEHHLEEARALVGIDMSGKVKFSRENGAAHLERHFASVERRDVDAWVTFPDAEAVRSYVRSMVTERAAAERVPELRRSRSCRDARERLRRPDLRVIRAADLIERKRNGDELAAEELAELVLAYARDEVPDYQMAAFLMAVWFRGLSEAETFALTDAMVRSGTTLDLRSALGRKVVDKHSTGGVGDKTSIAVAPLVAACGVPVAKMSGRGLGHTGGTLDKLEAIPGFRVELTHEELIDQVRRIGVAVVGQTAELVPADKRLYAPPGRHRDGRQHPAHRREHHVQEARRRSGGHRARRQGR